MLITTNDEFADRNVELEASLADMRAELEQVEEGLETYPLVIENAIKRIPDLESQITDSMVVMAQAVYDGTWRQIVSWDQLTDSQRDSITELVDTYDWLRTNSVNALQKMSTEAGTTVGEMINVLDHNYDATHAWGENLASVYDRVGEDATEGFMAWIQEMAQDNPAILSEIANSSDAELQQLVNAYTRNAGQLEDTLATAVGDEFDQVKDLFDRFGPEAQSSLRESVAAADFENPGGMMSKDVATGILKERDRIDNAMQDIGDSLQASATNIIAGFALGISGGNPQVAAASKGFANTFINAFRGEIQENSPSKVFRTSGENIVVGLIQGIKSNQSQPVTQMRTLAKSMSNAMNNQGAIYQNIGRDITQGLNQGLLNGESTVMATARRMANNIARTMRDALDINSPSRVMREQIGRQIPAGVAAGIDRYADYVVDSMKGLGKELLEMDFPNMSEVINMGPSLSLPSTSETGIAQYVNDVVINNKGMLDGATFVINKELDIEEISRKLAWHTKQQQARLWR